MWIHLLSQELIDGATSATATTTLTPQDLINLADAVWEKQLENGYEAQELMRLQNAILAGLLSKVGNQTPEFLSLDGTKVRVKYAVDGIGNRKKILEIDLT